MLKVISRKIVRKTLELIKKLGDTENEDEDEGDESAEEDES